MTLEEYRKFCDETKRYESGKTALTYTITGLAVESAEALGHYNKAIMQDGVLETGQLTPERKELLVKELGDVVWFLLATCDELGITLEEVMQINKDKLTSRLSRGVLVGYGDNR